MLKKPYVRPKLTKRRVPSTQAEEEAEKKGLSAEKRRAYVGGAINRAKQEKETGHGATKTKGAYEKPAIRQTTSAEHEREKEHHGKAYTDALNREHKAALVAAKRERSHEAAVLLARIRSRPPALSGSEKQVAWANQIRSAYLAKRRSEAQKLARQYRDDGAYIAKGRLESLAEEHDRKSASWWIDQRYGMGLSQYKGRQK